jgi:hypothetical protein
MNKKFIVLGFFIFSLVLTGAGCISGGSSSGSNAMGMFRSDNKGRLYIYILN